MAEVLLAIIADDLAGYALWLAHGVRYVAGVKRR